MRPSTTKKRIESILKNASLSNYVKYQSIKKLLNIDTKTPVRMIKNNSK